MFENYSKSGHGAYALIVGVGIWGLGQLGFTVTEAQALQLIEAVTVVYGIVMSVWGTFDRKDLVAGIKRA